MAKKKKQDKLWNDMQKSILKKITVKESTLNKRLSAYFKQEAAKLDREIAAFYMRYGQNNIIQFRQVMDALPQVDKDLLYQDVQAFVTKYPKYAHLVPVRENIYKLNRLEGLQASLRMHQLESAGKEADMVAEHLRQVAIDAYKDTSEQLMQQYNPEIAKLFVNRLSATDVTDNIMNNKAKLMDYLASDIAQGMARGDSYARIAKAMAERYTKVSMRDMQRLVYTQGTLVYNEATAHVVEQDFEQYQISTVGDNKVCEICRGLQDKIFSFKDRQVGVNFPPLHPWCRCSFTIYVEDRDAWLNAHLGRDEELRRTE